MLETQQRLVSEHGGWELRFTPTEILLGVEPIVKPRPKGAGQEAAPSSGEEQLPFVFYRDGIRAITFPISTPREELAAFFDAMRMVGTGTQTHEDLVTVLWQANLSHIQIESVPLEQSIYLTDGRGGQNTVGGQGSQSYGWSPAGAEIHRNIVQPGGAQGLHRDTFDDWELSDTYVDVPQGYSHLLPAMEYSRAHFRAAWDEERAVDWTREAPVVVHTLLTLDPSDEMRRSLVHAVVSWIGEAFQRSALEEVECALALLFEIDPDHTRGHGDLTTLLSQLDAALMAEYLDEGPPGEQARFAGMAVALGRPALELTVGVLSHSGKSRTRAAASTALCYLCADQPQLLERYLGDGRAELVLDVVFVLGQIGGVEVLDLLQLASQHPDPRVQRQVVHALGAVPAHVRIPQLLKQLDTRDPQLFNATLHMLAREKSPRVASALLALIMASELESRPEEIQLAVLSTLGEVADDESVPGLETVLNRGGWFARRSFLRNAAARTLLKIGTPKAMAVLQAGLKSRSGAVRGACQDALDAGAQT